MKKGKTIRREIRRVEAMLGTDTRAQNLFSHWLTTLPHRARIHFYSTEHSVYAEAMLGDHPIRFTIKSNSAGWGGEVSGF